MAIFLVNEDTGDIVEVFSDDKPVVSPPAKPWVIVKVVGLEVKDANAYIQAHISSSEFDTIRTQSGVDLAVPKMLAAHRYKIADATLKEAIESKARTMEITAKDLTSSLMDKKA